MKPIPIPSRAVQQLSEAFQLARTVESVVRATLDVPDDYVIDSIIQCFVPPANSESGDDGGDNDAR